MTPFAIAGVRIHQIATATGHESRSEIVHCASKAILCRAVTGERKRFPWKAIGARNPAIRERKQKGANTKIE